MQHELVSTHKKWPHLTWYFGTQYGASSRTHTHTYTVVKEEKEEDSQIFMRNLNLILNYMGFQLMKTVILSFESVIWPGRNDS